MNPIHKCFNNKECYVNSSIPVLAEYLQATAGIAAINPTYFKRVQKLVEAHRRVDFHVDTAAFLEDQAEEDKAVAAKRRIHLKTEEKWFDKIVELEEELPKRELANAYKQLAQRVLEEN